MATSPTHRGWKRNQDRGILAAVYNTAQPGTQVLPTNTALDGILIGTPVTPALAVDSMVLSDLVASGDILIAANNGGNSQAWLWVDSSAGTMTLYGAGTAIAVLSSTVFEIEDGKILALGNDQDQAIVNRASTLDAATVLAGVLIGTPVKPALAANSLVISNVTADGDVLLATQTGGNSAAWLWVDTSANLMTLYAVGVSAIELGVGLVTVNEGSADINFRVETNGIQYAIYADGGKDALVLGSNTDTSSADQLITVSRAARSNTAATSYYDLRIVPAGAVTTTGVTAVVATLGLEEPNITVSANSVTNAATLYIAGQPTEGGTTNSAIRFGAAANISGTTSITINEDSEDLDFRIESNGNSNMFVLDAGLDAIGIGGAAVASQTLTVTNAAVAATGRVAKVTGTIAAAALTDGYGAFEVDITLSGSPTDHSAAASAWINITGGTVPVGTYICARNDGIYEASAATITNAKLIFGARMHKLTDDTDGLCFPFSLNTNNTAITALFDCQNRSDFGLVASAGTAENQLLPIMRDAAGNLRYVMLYTN